MKFLPLALLPVPLHLAAEELQDAGMGDGSMMDEHGAVYYPQGDGSFVDAYGNAFAPIGDQGIYVDPLGNTPQTPTDRKSGSGPGQRQPVGDRPVQMGVDTADESAPETSTPSSHASDDTSDSPAPGPTGNLPDRSPPFSGSIWNRALAMSRHPTRTSPRTGPKRWAPVPIDPRPTARPQKPGRCSPP